MKRYLCVGGLLIYLLTGFFAVRSNERAVVCRFGRALIVTDTATNNSELSLYGSGLHYDWPWPFATVHRINPNEVRTLDVPVYASGKGASPQGPLYLTADTNFLHLQIGVQYRVSEQNCGDYLFATEAPETQLALIVESVAADLVSRSGVDYVHPLGLATLRQQLQRDVQSLLRQRSLGLVIEEVAIRSVTPPASVQAYFLDVANARADKQNSINAAAAYAASRQESARAESQSILDAAKTDRQQRVAAAQGAANRFRSLIAQFQTAGQPTTAEYAQARNLALQRMYWGTVREVFGRAKGNVWVDNQQQTDLTIWRQMNKGDE